MLPLSNAISKTNNQPLKERSKTQVSAEWTHIELPASERMSGYGTDPSEQGKEIRARSIKGSGRQDLQTCRACCRVQTKLKTEV